MQSKRLCSLLISCLLSLPLWSTSIFTIGEKDTLPVSYVALFDEMSDTIAKHFYDADFIKKSYPALTKNYRNKIQAVEDRGSFNALIRSYLAAFKTSHTSYHTQADYTYYHLASIFEILPFVKEAFNHQEIKYPSIGLLTQKNAAQTLIIGVLDGSSAHQAGLKKGDIIQGLAEGAYSQEKLKEYLDQAVNLQILRNGQALEFKVNPKLINPNKELEAAVKASIQLIERANKTIGYIHLWSFAGKQYYELLKDAILYGKLKDADGLILDIRDGWGGASPEYLNIFNQNIPQLQMYDQAKNEQRFDTQWRKPVVLLTNNGSRSGKELLAYGFKKYNMGTVLGEKTAGAVTAGRIFFLADRSLMYLAVRGVTVDGEVLEGKGVEPDIKAKDLTKTPIDEQLEAAIGALLK